MRVLAIRLSAMGDVALTLPAIRAFRKDYPENELIVLTRPAFAPFFASDPGIVLFTPDLKRRHKGLPGIWKIYCDLLKHGRIDCVTDLHDVIRSKILGLIFRSKGTPVYVIDKGRKEKRSLVSGRKKYRLKHSVERYAEVFAAAGFNISPVRGKCIVSGKEAGKKAAEMLSGKALVNIGIAPFAKHHLKQWPVEKMISLMKMISSKTKVQFWLFGAAEESALHEDIEKVIPDAVSLCGKLSLEEELAVMERLSFMIAMDSSNMHMAALCGTKVVSIWGATDPMAGFGAWGQPEEYSLGISHSDLQCRPCSVYGKGTCRRGDFACMEWLTPEMVFNRIERAGLMNVKI